MKTKISRILGVGLTIAVLASMLVMATPVSAGTLAFSSEVSGVVLPIKTGSDIWDIEVAGNGTTIYATLGTLDYDTLSLPGVQALVKSTNGGATWSAVNTGATTVSVSQVAAAPDLADGAFVAIVKNDGAGDVVAISSDGGNTWASAPAIAGATTYNDLAVSRLLGTVRTLAAATDNTVSTLALGGVFGGTWTAVTGIGSPTAGVMREVAFSPNFAGDRTLAVLTATATDVVLQLYNVTSQAWNGVVYNGWGTGIDVTGAAAASGAVSASSLVLAPTFLGADAASRVAYVGLAAATTQGLFRVSDTAAGSLYSAAGIGSIGLNAAGDKLVAGAYATNNVIRVASPATATSVSALGASKRPGGPTANDVRVAFAGTTVVAGTSGTDSAFSKSADDGKSFVDISLVDNAFGPVDFAVAADGSKINLANVSGGTLSVWRKVTAWERVLAVATTASNAIIRNAPDNADVIYVAEIGGGGQIYFTNDGGATTWLPRYSPNAVVDMVVETVSTVYVLTSGAVSKSADSGFVWDNPKATLPTGVVGATLTFISAGNLIVGDTDGDVAYSTDGNATWTKVGGAVTAGSNLKVTADKLSSGGVLYAASATAGANIYRWTIGTSTVWTAMRTTAIPGSATGIVLNSGVLYVVAYNGSDNSSMYRTLSPATAASDASWSDIALVQEVTSTGTVYSLGFSDTPSSLIATVGADKNPKLWALSFGTRTALESFTDILVTATPAMTTPAANFLNPINVETGMANNVVFQWTAVTGTPVTTTYTFQLALDSAFTQVVGTLDNYAKGLAIVGPTGSDLVFPFQADTTYYWRVRVKGPVASNYAAGRSFKIDTVAPLKLQAPASGAPGVSVNPTFVWSPIAGATTYELVVSDDPTFAIITFSRTTSQPVFASDEQLAYSTVYYWRVRASAPATAVTPFATGIFTTEARPVPPTTPPPPVTVTQTSVTVTIPPAENVEIIPPYLLWIIIGIGAILVIALIVLIARTRRVS